jgi:hypothetical protein
MARIGESAFLESLALMATPQSQRDESKVAKDKNGPDWSGLVLTIPRLPPYMALAGAGSRNRTGRPVWLVPYLSGTEVGRCDHDGPDAYFGPATYVPRLRVTRRPPDVREATWSVLLRERNELTVMEGSHPEADLRRLYAAAIYTFPRPERRPRLEHSHRARGVLPLGQPQRMAVDDVGKRRPNGGPSRRRVLGLGARWLTSPVSDRRGRRRHEQPGSFARPAAQLG